MRHCHDYRQSRENGSLNRCRLATLARVGTNTALQRGDTAPAFSISISPTFAGRITCTHTNRVMSPSKMQAQLHELKHCAMMGPTARWRSTYGVRSTSAEPLARPSSKIHKIPKTPHASSLQSPSSHRTRHPIVPFRATAAQSCLSLKPSRVNP